MASLNSETSNLLLDSYSSSTISHNSYNNYNNNNSYISTNSAVASLLITTTTTTTTTTPLSKATATIVSTSPSSSSMVSPADATHSRKSRLTVPSGSPDVLGSGASLSSTSSTPSVLRSNNGHVVGGLNNNTGSSSSNNNSNNNNNRHAQYVARLLDVRQMDVQSALDQMKTLLSTRPHVVYKTSYYRKQTKNHWARDDPAFSVLQVLFLVIASIAYAVAFRVSVSGAVAFLLQSVLWNWLGCGVVVATLGREMANRHLTVHQSSSHVRQSVEWLYAFDIHCNAFVPLFFLLYGVQFFLLPLVLGKSFGAFLAANTLYAAALSWYWYITHLGYRALPFLSNTEVFLFPIAAIVLIYLLNLIGYPFELGLNISRFLAHLFFD